MKKIFCLKAALIGVVSSCGAPVVLRSGVKDKPSTFEAQSVTFSEVRMKVFSARCIACHAQFASYAGVVGELDSIRLAVAQNRMPKGSPLSDDLKQLLESWIVAGAPPDVGDERSSVVPLAAQWTSLYSNVFAPRCIVCHSPTGQAKFLDLSTRSGIEKNRDRVFGDGKRLIDTAHPESSYLVEVLQDDDEPMPPKWSSIRRINQDEIKVLVEWIRLNIP